MHPILIIIIISLFVYNSLSLTEDWFHWREPGGLDADTVTIFVLAKGAQAFTVY